MEQQKVIFENYNDYISKRNIMYYNIKKKIIACIDTDEKYYSICIYGISSTLDLTISGVLDNELNKFTENKCIKWCDEISIYIMLGIRGFFDSLIKIKRINDFTAGEYVELIYNTIIYQLDNDEHSPSLLEDIRIINNDSDTE